MPTIITRAAGSLKSMGFAGSSSSSAAFLLAKSLRFRSSNSTYVSRTPASTTSRTTWTWSGWVKRGAMNTFENLFCSDNQSDGGTTGNYGYLRFQSNTIMLGSISNGTYENYIYTSGSQYTDTAAWYHIVATADTTNSVATDRYKIYVNGVRQSVTDIGIPQNFNTYINTASYQHNIGRNRYGGGGSYFDGYLAEVNFIDGQALTPSSFGATNALTGQWSPIAYTGTYGTNGFHLTFANTTSTTTLGYDTSGNSNNWTTNNISLTAGSTYDSINDVPTLTSATVANYAVLNPFNSSGVTLSNGNLDCLATATGRGFGTISMKAVDAVNWYWEMTPIVATGAYNNHVGIYADNIDPTTDANRIVWRNDGNVFTNGSLSGTIASYTVGDTVAMAFNSTTRSLTYYKNGTSLGSFTATDPGTGGGFFPHILQNSGAEIAVNFGQQGFKYTPPSGYVALNTYNLPTPAIAQGNKYMDVTLYAGAGANQSVINAGAFRPDVVWIKNRTNSSNHQLVDSVRGVSLGLFPNLVDGESTSSNMTSSFNSNGFSIAGNSNNLNASGSNYVAWQWQAAVGNNVTNTAGSVNSTVSANTTAGFSIVTYTGPGGSNGTIGHGLGSIPSMIWTKVRSGINADWAVYHSAVGNTSALFLDTTAAATSGVGYWNNTSPTANVFSVGNSANTNYSATITYVAYCWAPVAGYSAFGSYVGNGTANTGPFVYTGFRPKLIMIKSTAGTTGDWMVWDTARDPINQAHRALLWDSANAEVSNDPYSNFSIFSNGFCLEESVSSPGYGNNISGYTYIYAAFAENPFKYSNGR